MFFIMNKIDMSQDFFSYKTIATSDSPSATINSWDKYLLNLLIWNKYG